ncbi:DUF1800 domain-containing protein [Kineococcus rhizosphaerae]|uniref:Uncharacterized protein DUF1800 n=1 Tax=Kineococcus rhizosphaerae TaxID=559628 RepID=A0A2T0R0H4_9ACTN|nr:DUF1800 domain-containing protein [Kineococcus rhizosphaerae]PRY12568.1 uncharacterized protein DUF1800 [Kineococcus rhizosphaerae]
MPTSPVVSRGSRRAAPTPFAHESAAAQLHLLRRATWGPTPAALAEVARLGTAAWIDRQLNPGTVDDGAVDAFAGRMPFYWRSAADLISGGYAATGWNAMLATGRLTLARQIWSERQLFEVVVDVFNNVLNVTNPSSEVWGCRQDYDRNVVRRHAFGGFGDMLVASARHQAMLIYLDNASSTAQHPNENYGRELMELHTLGVEAGYSEEDVKNSARLLTGLTIDARGNAVFDANRHDGGGRTIFGFVVPPHAPADGGGWIDAYLRWLAVHPLTARRISLKLATRFVSDTPPATLLDAMTRTWLQTGGQIVPVLRALFDSAEFWASAGQKVRTPQEDYVATLRTLGTRMETSGVEGITKIFWHVLDQGHAPMGWAAPNGYPDVAAAWTSPSGTLNRWNRHMDFAAGWYPPELQFTPALQLLPSIPSTWGALVDALGVRITGQKPTADEKAGLLLYAGRSEGQACSANDPWIRNNLQYLVALTLDSPTFTIR